MSLLAAQPLWLLLLLATGGLAVVVVVARAVGERLYAESATSAASIAQPMMPALGAAFAVLAAFAVANAATGLRSAEADVSKEANAAGRLAWASTAAGAAGREIRTDLAGYLEATLADEWDRIDEISPGDGAAFDELAALQRQVRQVTGSDELGTPQQTELLAALDDVTASRRSRFASAEPLSGAVLLLLVLAGMAMLVNATMVTLPHRRKAVATLGALVVVTGVSIAIVLSLSSPFSGSFTASNRPLAEVAEDLRKDRFDLGT